jgi:chemotaxis response regulator CheB
MTGMGADGAKGLLEMNQAGACTIAQEEYFVRCLWYAERGNPN